MSGETPGGAISARPLHFIWICDTSGSMAGSKIQQLNFAIKEALPEMRAVADQNENAQIFLRVITFSDGARWQVAQPTKLEDFRWSDLVANGCTDMGEALTKVAEQMEPARMPNRGLVPVLVLLSDGQPTDDFNRGLKALMEQPWGRKAVRIAIAIGKDAAEGVLSRFIGNPELKVLHADQPQDLVALIRWASTQVVASVLKTPSQIAAAGAPGGAVGAQIALPLPPAATVSAPGSASSVW